MSVDISVVIPTFRRPKQLVEAAASVLAQSDVNLQLIVVDDSPEGSGRDAVDSLNDSRIRYIKNPVPTGGLPSIVRNMALPYAEGAFLHFLDDDDIVPQGHYTAVKHAFLAHPEVGMVFGRIAPFGDCPADQLEHEKRYFADAAKKAAASRRFGPKWAFTGRMLFDKVLLVCSAAVFRRECVMQLGGFDPEIRLMEDAEFNVRVMRGFGAHFMDRVALQYRIGNPSLMHSPNPDPSQLATERAGHRKMRTKYRKQRGFLEYYGLAFFTRTILKVA
jgi:glycosyltransferase involved in cell wall biosynthesis